MATLEMEFQGLEDLIKIAESLATESQLENTNKKILKECANLALSDVKPKIHRSKDNSQSGRSSSRPPGHAADNVPVSNIKKKQGNLFVIVGWEKTDNSPFYYMKMEEWGSSQRPPHHSFGTVNKALRSSYDEIALVQYSKLIKKLEG